MKRNVFDKLKVSLLKLSSEIEINLYISKDIIDCDLFEISIFTDINNNYYCELIEKGPQKNYLSIVNKERDLVKCVCYLLSFKLNYKVINEYFKDF